MTRVLKDEDFGKDFFRWLTTKKGLRRESAYDVMSRCRRVERTLSISLREIVQSQDALYSLILRIDNEPHAFLKPGSNVQFGVGVLKHAVTCYAEYKGDPDTSSNNCLPPT
jgi:hypothetical protein